MKRPKASLRQQIRDLQARLDEEVGALRAELGALRAEIEALTLENQRLRERLKELEKLVSLTALIRPPVTALIRPLASGDFAVSATV